LGDGDRARHSKLEGVGAGRSKDEDTGSPWRGTVGKKNKFGKGVLPEGKAGGADYAKVKRGAIHGAKGEQADVKP